MVGIWKMEMAMRIHVGSAEEKLLSKNLCSIPANAVVVSSLSTRTVSWNGYRIRRRNIVSSARRPSDSPNSILQKCLNNFQCISSYSDF